MSKLASAIFALCSLSFLSAAEVEREMATDRPDQTESPYTVPTGMIQIESGLFSYTRSLDAPLRSESFEWGNVNVKLGLSTNTDLQIVWTPWTERRQQGSPSMEGSSDLTVRAKWNLLGNDGGTVAAGLMPYVKAPTASKGVGNGEWEGGLIVPVTFQLSETWSLGTMGFAGLVADDAGDYHLEPGLSASLGCGLTESTGTYLELYGEYAGDAERDWQVALDAGLTFALSTSLVLDIGVNWFFAGDQQLNPFIGLSKRF